MSSKNSNSLTDFLNKLKTKYSFEKYNQFISILSNKFNHFDIITPEKINSFLNENGLFLSDLIDMLNLFEENEINFSFYLIQYLNIKEKPKIKHDRLQNEICFNENIAYVNYYEYLFKNVFSLNNEWPMFKKIHNIPLPMSLRFHNVAFRNFFEELFKKHYLSNKNNIFPLLHGVYDCEDSLYHSNQEYVDFTRTLHSGGILSFQEIVSIIPVIILNPLPCESVIDLCASPGSKSLQILDFTVKNWQYIKISDVLKNSIVILNEKDKKKASQILPSRLKRYGAPNALICNGDASNFPFMHNLKDADLNNTALLFDKILCDVPCSGDGTIRKCSSIINTWSDNYIKKLTPLQYKILKRGYQLLKSEGLLVYSTCSLNILENENVIDTFLTEFPDAELVNVNKILLEKSIKINSKGSYLSDSLSYKNKNLFNYTLRIFPHHNNTGGFFIAAFKKKCIKSFIPKISENKFSIWKNIKTYRILDIETDTEWNIIMAHFGIKKDLFLDSSSFSLYYHVKSSGKINRIFLCTKKVHSYIFITSLYRSPGIELVSAGVRFFEKYADDFLTNIHCRWRVSGESAQMLGNFATKQKLIFKYCSEDKNITNIKHDTGKLRILLSSGNLLIDCLDLQSHLYILSFDSDIKNNKSVSSFNDIGSVLIGIDLSSEFDKLQNLKTIPDLSEIYWIPGLLFQSKIVLTVDKSIRRLLCKTLYNIQINE